MQNRIQPLEARVEQLTTADRSHQSRANENSDQMQALNNRIKSLEEKIKKHARSDSAQNKICPLPNAMKVNNVIVSSIPEDKDHDGNDNFTVKINALLNKLWVSVSNFQAKRIDKEAPSKSWPILVELANLWDKRKFYSARLHLRNKGLNNIFINEDLEKRQAEIYFHTRRAKKNNYNRWYSSHIEIRRNHTDSSGMPGWPVHFITKLQDRRATTPKQRRDNESHHVTCCHLGEQR